MEWYTHTHTHTHIYTHKLVGGSDNGNIYENITPQILLLEKRKKKKIAENEWAKHLLKKLENRVK